ncbi:MAG: 50S ribosomal protein L21 [Proteobacteria bacterium]|nr:50S ribosomal protein L21 [Pseudomonadota bacterium]
MYAVVKSGGKQYKVEEGDIINVESLEGEIGATIELDSVLLIADSEKIKIGQPLVPDAKVIGSIINHGKAKKIIIFKSKRRKGYRKKQGHRQTLTSLKINKIIG